MVEGEDLQMFGVDCQPLKTDVFLDHLGLLLPPRLQFFVDLPAEAEGDHFQEYGAEFVGERFVVSHQDRIDEKWEDERHSCN